MNVLWTILFSALAFTVMKTGGHNRPIIGILTQEISPRLNRTYHNIYHSYIAASYVKFVEGAGARAVPIWIGMNNSYYEDILSKVNGILWPGGTASFFDQEEGYAVAGAAIYRIAECINEKGVHFPIFSINLGFELLMDVASNHLNRRKFCSSMNQSLPLEFTYNYRESKLFENASLDVIRILRDKTVTANYHNFCITKNNLRRANILDKFNVLSLNRDINGLEFISSLEHKQFPFYGLQFHPEKNLYEWVIGRNISHTSDAIIVSQYFANFFVKEARKNPHNFTTESEERQSLIYNYPVTYTALHDSSFQQCYMFKKNDRNAKYL